MLTYTRTHVTCAPAPVLCEQYLPTKLPSVIMDSNTPPLPSHLTLNTPCCSELVSHTSQELQTLQPLNPEVMEALQELNGYTPPQVRRLLPWHH